MATEEHELLVAVNISVDGHQQMAGFEVSINGRFWVSTEGPTARDAESGWCTSLAPDSTGSHQGQPGMISVSGCVISACSNAVLLSRISSGCGPLSALRRR
jgi:hypothetical protein